MSTYSPANSPGSMSNSSSHTPRNTSSNSSVESTLPPGDNSESGSESECYWSCTSPEDDESPDNNMTITSESYRTWLNGSEEDREHDENAACATMFYNNMENVDSNYSTTVPSTISTASESSSRDSGHVAAHEVVNSSNEFNLPDLEVTTYEFNYPTIKSFEERRQYKVIFEEDYEEYIPLLTHVDAVRDKFHELHATLQDMQSGTREYHCIELQIVYEYQLLFVEEELRRKRRFDFLNAKLAHIKQLINDFDMKICAQQEKTMNRKKKTKKKN